MLIKLPVCCDPTLSRFPNYAHALSILFADETRRVLLLINDFMQISYDCKQRSLCNAQYDWMYTTSKNLLYECALFPDEMRSDLQCVWNFMCAMLENERYCILNLDEYYCPNTQFANKRHHINDYLVYGTDTDNQTVFLRYYDETQGYMDIEMATSWFVRAIDHSGLFFAVHCFRKNQPVAIEPFNLKGFLHAAKQYTNPGSLLDCSQQLVCGMSAIGCFKDQLNMYGDDNVTAIKRSVVSLYEHENIMQLRLSYLFAEGRISEEVLHCHAPIQNVVEQLYLQVIKHRKEGEAIFPDQKCKKRKDGLANTFTDRLAELEKLEERFYSKLVCAIVVEEKAQ